MNDYDSTPSSSTSFHHNCVIKSLCATFLLFFLHFSILFASNKKHVKLYISTPSYHGSCVILNLDAGIVFQVENLSSLNHGENIVKQAY
jgi:hypothetical protein